MRPHKKFEKLYPGQIYHIYNRTNNRETMFVDEKDHLIFLAKMEKYISPFADILSFNLLRNHFHLLIKVREKDEFLSSFSKEYILLLSGGCQLLIFKEEDNMEKILENRFSAFFNSYATYFNIRHRRHGNLFHRPYCRKNINSHDYFLKAVFYINTNSVRHGFNQNFLDHKWTSYHQAAHGDASLLNLEMLFEMFESKKKFTEYHFLDHVFENEQIFTIEEEEE